MGALVACEVRGDTTGDGGCLASDGIAIQKKNLGEKGREPGYSGILTLPSYLTQFGYATLSLFPRGQGENQKEWKLEEGTWVAHNLIELDRHYYRGAYMDYLPGVDFLDSRPEIDSTRIGVWGLS